VFATLTRFRELTARDRRVFITALVLLPVAAAIVRVVRFTTVERWLAHAPKRYAGRDEAASARAVARMVVAAANRGPYKPACLPISVVLQWLLRRQGIDATLCLGVRRRDGRLDAHAWVEHRGQPLLDALAGHERLADFDRPAAASRGAR
jgi:hypothetical protein